MKAILEALYPMDSSVHEGLQSLIKRYKTKKKANAQWIESGNTVGMMLYVDLFAGDLETLGEKVDYFLDLGVTLLHLMPLLKPRSGENDGGYAVQDYRAVDPQIGDMETLKKVIAIYHKAGIKICIDYVINHTADDHAWAIAAKAGDPHYLDYYFVHDDAHIPQQMEKHLGQVFPKVAPGNYTYLPDLGKWVMTTFYPYQWDLNYANPNVLLEMIENLLFLASIGVDMIRLDAIPYIWKRMETDCRNLPEVHQILNLFRMVISQCYPNTALLGEAIMTPEVIKRYFGSEAKPECHILYNASYMVEIWNSLATRDARHLSLMPRYAVPENSVWINYARCHDDIGWGLDEEKIRQLGFDSHAHKSFLIDFYLGSLPGSFAVGELYEFNPETMDARNSGTLASLAGLEKALAEKDRYAKELAIKRIQLIHAMVLLKKGIPMLYSGDEVGQLNDYSYRNVAAKNRDSRWLHRPAFNSAALEHLKSCNHPVALVYESIKETIALRKKVSEHAFIDEEIAIPEGNDHIFVLLQKLSNGDDVLLLFNLTEDRRWFYTSTANRYGLRGMWMDLLSGKTVDLESESVLLGPYEYLMLKICKKDLIL